MQIQWQLWWCTARAHGLLSHNGRFSVPHEQRHHVGAGRCLRRLVQDNVSSFLCDCLFPTCFFGSLRSHCFTCFPAFTRLCLLMCPRLMTIDVCSIDVLIHWEITHTHLLRAYARTEAAQMSAASMTATVCLPLSSLLPTDTCIKVLNPK